MRLKAILCYIRRPKSIEGVSRHFLTSLMMEEEMGVVENSEIERLVSEPMESVDDGYVIRNPNDIKGILKHMGFNESLIEDKIVVELLLKRID